MRRALLLAAAVLAASPALAVRWPDKPPKTDWYVDGAGLVSDGDRQALNAVCGALFKDEKVPMYVVTIESLASMDALDMTIERYAAGLFDEWGIGFQDRNYGMLLLVSKADRKARIEFGAGWDHRHDNDAVTVMQDLIIPQFRLGDHSAGIVAGAEALDRLARGLELPKPKQPWWAPILMIALVLGVIGIAFSLFKSGRTGWGWAFIVGVGLLLLFILKNAGKGSGGGFGGGSSGGGGATGSW